MITYCQPFRTRSCNPPTTDDPKMGDLCREWYVKILHDDILFLDLLVSLPNSAVTEGHLTYSPKALVPLYQSVDAHVPSGSPGVITSPVGPALNFTDGDVIIYDFNFNQILPCPFNMSRCEEDITVSFWFRWFHTFAERYTTCIQLGPGFKVYKGHHPTTHIKFRWTSLDKISWYNQMECNPDEWHHITATWQLTHTTVYRNGRKIVVRQPDPHPSNPFNNVVAFGSTSHPGSFATSSMYIWGGAMSPASIWRLYQDGLPDISES